MGGGSRERRAATPTGIAGGRHRVVAERDRYCVVRFASFWSPRLHQEGRLDVVRLTGSAPRRVARLRMSTHERDANPRDELPPSAHPRRRGRCPRIIDRAVRLGAQNLQERDALASTASAASWRRSVWRSTSLGSSRWTIRQRTDPGSGSTPSRLTARGDDAVGEPADTSATATATAAPPPGSSADGDGADEPFPASMLGWESDAHTPLTVEQVAARTARGNRLVILSVKAHGPSGQGKALNAAYRAAKANLVGEMESDDLRPPDAFATLRDALMSNPEWDCATSRVRLCGWQRPGMERWIDWQNEQVTGSHGAPFIEIPRFARQGCTGARPWSAWRCATAGRTTSPTY